MPAAGQGEDNLGSEGHIVVLPEREGFFLDRAVRKVRSGDLLRQV